MHEHPKVTHSAGGVVLNEDGKILIVSQKGDSWSLPKGHVETGEELLDAARREVAEESGITQIDLIKEYPMYERFKIAEGGVGEDRSELKLIHMFLFRTTQIELNPTDKENPEAIWLSPEKVEAMLTHPKDRQFMQSIFADVMMHIQSKVGQKNG
ncbi:MAG: NUDIX domain-containing protein [Patescibacteria group bacterium]